MTRHECTPVPPPIPPVRYVPGVNVQEQLCNMAERVNVSINRWNQIQAQCYRALDQVVGAAVNNDVYYAPDEVRYMEGYSEDAGCSYGVVEARAVDRAGKPIFVHLRPAFNNETNSGARENITDVSFVTSAQMVMTAVQATETRWKGTTVFNGNPGASAPDDTVWICGWTRNGVLRFFSGDVSEGTLRQNRMVNCIGPVFPIIKDCKPFTEVLGSLGEEPGSIQAMGWKPNGNKVFFNCGIYDTPGMTPTQVMKTLQGMGCATAVITSYQTQAVSAWDATPIAGTESAMTYANDGEVITAPGMTGGMTFLGKLTAAPIQWSIPMNCAAWVITKKPYKGWKNAFTTEVANVVQRLGNQENSMSSIMGQLDGENKAISKLQYDVQQNTDKIAALTTQVSGFDERISNIENRVNSAEDEIADIKSEIEQINTDLENEIQTRIAQVKELTEADARERQERQAADAALTTRINAEATTRESQDRILQNHIDQEATDRAAADNAILADLDTERHVRAQADQNLTAALEAEISARRTKDAQHEAQIEELAAQEQKDHTAQQAEIDALKSGDGLPIATTTSVGVIKVGRNLTVEVDGTLNAVAEAGGDNVVEGAGIKITENTEGQKVISIDDDVVVNEDELAAVNQRVSDTNSTVSIISKGLELTEGKVTENTNSINEIKEQVSSINGDITRVEGKVDEAVQDIAGIKDGTALPVASAETLGAIKVGANLSISEDGVLSAASGGSEGSGETVAQGSGISVTHDEETKVATVALSTETQNKLAEIATLKTAVAGKADRSTVESVQEDVTKLTQDVTDTTAKLEDVERTANTAASGVSSLNSSVTALGNRVDTNTQNINANGTEIQANKDAIEKLQGDLGSVDDTVTAAMDHLTDVETGLTEKVSKAGDTMTGALTTPRVLVSADENYENLATFDVVASERETDVTRFAPQIATAVGTKLFYTPAVVGPIVDPKNSSDASTKNYVDTEIGKVNSTARSALEQAGAATEAVQEMQTALDGKLDKTGGAMTGNLTMAQGSSIIMDPSGTSTLKISGNASSVSFTTKGRGPLDVPVALAMVNQQVGSSDDRNFGIQLAVATGDTTTAAPIFVGTPTQPHMAATKEYVDSVAGGESDEFVKKSGDTMNGDLTVIGKVLVTQGVYHGTTGSIQIQGNGANAYLQIIGPLASAKPERVCIAAFGNGVAVGTTQFAGMSYIPVRIGEPVASYDAATKNYVDTIVGQIQTALSKIVS